MQKLRLLLLLTVILSCSARAQQVPYASCPGCWDADSLGNHRAAILFNGTGKVAHVRIPWRLRTPNPAGHRLIIQDGKTGARILNAAPVSLTRESGDILFEPVSGKGKYYVYYLPYRNEGHNNYPKGVYWRPDTTAAPEWLHTANASTPLNCTVTAIQSIDTFNTFYPMEVIATEKETAALKAKYPGRSFLLFPEDASHPIAMQNDLPQRWIKKGAGNTLSIYSLLGEYCPYQIGVYALTPSQMFD